MLNASDETIRKRQFKAIKSNFEKAGLNHGNFPKCNDLYPDCPKEPSLKNRMCRICPKTDDLEKPRLDDN